MHYLLCRLVGVGLSLCLICLVMIIASPSLSADNPLQEMDPQGYPSPNTGCLAPGKCHAGIEPIRAHNSDMAKQIYAKGLNLGDPNMLSATIVAIAVTGTCFKIVSNLSYVRKIRI